MKIDVTGLFNGDNTPIDINYTLDLHNLVYSDYRPIQNGATVNGSVSQHAGIVCLNADVSFLFSGVCDRCAEDVNKQMSFSVDKILVRELANDADADSDEYIVLESGVLDLDDYIREEVQLFLPSKVLCKPDCKGLCSNCGKNLNLGDCDCKKAVDPRMSALLQLLDEDNNSDVE